jgi:hypothetical protein
MPNEVPIAQHEEIATRTGLAVEQVSNGVVMFGNKPFVNLIGKRYKMDERFGPGKWGTRVDQIKGDDYQHMMMMWGKKPPCIIMKAQIIFNGDVIAEDYGWCTPQSAAAGRKQFDEDGLGIAASKAEGRAMAQLVANGFASEEKADSRERMNIETGSLEAGFLKETARFKKEIGDEAYYEILKSNDAEHADDASIQGKPKKMQAILDAMNGGEAFEVVSDVNRQELLQKINDEDVPQQAREDAVVDLLDSLCYEEAMGKIPDGAKGEQTYAEIMAEYVGEAMKDSNFAKAYDVLKRSMELV